MLLPVIKVPRRPINGASSTIAPSKIILGTTTANILGQEGEVIKKIMPITLTGTAIIGIIGYLLTMI